MPVSLVSDSLEATLRAGRRGRPRKGEELTSPICYAEGCERPRAKRAGRFNSRYCTMHADRRYRLGVHWAPVRKINPRGSGGLSYGYHVIRKNGKLLISHRLIWEEAYGPIPVGHVIHHRNGNRLDNRLENLQCLTQSEHWRIHRQAGWVVECL